MSSVYLSCFIYLYCLSIVAVSSIDVHQDLMKCRSCQIKMFADADVVLAAHGAGLTNTMFMRPGGLVIEVVSRFDSRHAPVIGIFPRLSGITHV